MTGIAAGHRAPPWWGVAMAAFVLAVVLLAARPLAAQARPHWVPQDGSYGNDQPQPYAVLYGPGQSAYRPGKLVALPDGESLVADGSVLGITKLTEEGAPNLSFGNFGTGGAKRGTADRRGERGIQRQRCRRYPERQRLRGRRRVLAGDHRLRRGQGTAAPARLPPRAPSAPTARSPSPSSPAKASSTRPSRPPPRRQECSNTRLRPGRAPPTSTTAADVAVQPDGTILVAGTEHVGSPRLTALLVDRIASEGGGQESFSLQVEGQPTEGDAIAAGPSGTIYVAATEYPGTTRAKVMVAQLVETPLPLGPPSPRARARISPSRASSGARFILNSTPASTPAVRRPASSPMRWAAPAQTSTRLRSLPTEIC